MTSTRTHRARTLRQSSGLAEDRVWARLRGGRIDGHKFRRQHPVGPYYADFACERIRLIIELDGPVHLQPDVIERDRKRQNALEALGWSVIRFTNEQALHMPEVLTEAVRRQACRLEL